MEVKGILLYQGFPILRVAKTNFTKHPELSKGWFVAKIGREKPWLSNILISGKAVRECAIFFYET